MFHTIRVLLNNGEDVEMAAIGKTREEAITNTLRYTLYGLNFSRDRALIIDGHAINITDLRPPIPMDCFEARLVADYGEEEAVTGRGSTPGAAVELLLEELAEVTK